VPPEAPALDWAELLRAMGRFGLSSREASLYLLALRRGRATARELTRDAGLDRVLAYRTLDGMRARGLVQVTVERPRRYVAVPPRVVFERNLLERRRALEDDASLARDLGRRLPELAETSPAGGSRFEVITGGEAIYPFVREMVRRATRDVATMITPRALRESFRARTYEELPRFLRRGGRFRMIVAPDPFALRLVARLRGSGRGLGRAEVRALDQPRVRLTVVDGRESVVFLVAEPGASVVPEVAVWSDTPEFVEAQTSLFEATWAESVPIRSVPRDRSSGRALGRRS
jgi:HTH-type transcriptional regulator, sugar sensing transcriptional regulator